MTLDMTFRSTDGGDDRPTWERGAALRVYDSPVPGCLSLWPTGADRGSRLDRDGVRRLRDALTAFLGADPEPATFAPGDLVLVGEVPTTTTGGYVDPDVCGKVGRVSQRMPSSGNVSVRFDDEYSQSIDPTHLTRVVPLDRCSPASDAVGDRVVVLDVSGDERNAVLHATGTVTAVEPDLLTVDQDGEDFGTTTMWPERFGRLVKADQ